MYIIRGYLKNLFGESTRRYIQLHPDIGHPVIKTKSGYRKIDQVLFSTEQEAYGFLYKFMNSKNRRTQYEIVWEVVNYKPNPSYGDDRNWLCYPGSTVESGTHWRTGSTRKLYELDTEYGKCFTYKYMGR